MFSKYIIYEGASILDALIAINNMGRNEALTLFVSDTGNSIIGALTDGDVRRCLIKGRDLTAKVEEIANRNFTYLKAWDYDTYG